MPVLYLGFDVFEPTAFDSSAATPDGRFFIVLQPVIFLQNNAADQISLKDYFNLLGSDLFSKIDVKVITPDIAAKILAAAPSDLCPVPFPPETTILFDKISWDGLAAPITIPATGTARTIGGYATTAGFTSPFLLEKGNWPHFAAVNNAAPRITVWGDLSPDQQNDVLAWIAAAVGLVAHHAVTDPSTLTNTERSVLAILQGVGLANDAALSSDTIKTKLLPAAPQLYARFLAASPLETPKYLPKQFVYSEQQLTTNELLLMALDPVPTPPKPLPNAGDLVALSYHERLWNQCEFKCATAAAADTATISSIQSALGRLFGFGERLYWPRRDDECFIHYGTPDEQPPDTKGWIYTGVHSLLGQVFGFQLPFDKKLTNFSVDLQIQGKSLVASPLVSGAGQTGMLEVAQNALVDWYATKPPKKVAAGLSLDPSPDLAKGFFVYQPKIAACVKVQTPDNATNLYAVPSALLDAVDPTPRWDQPKGAASEQMTVSNGPRYGLLCSDVYGGTKFFDGPQGSLAPCLRLRVTLKRTPVPFQAQATYLLSLATPPLDSELQSIRSAFAGIAGLSPELWVAKDGSSAPQLWKITPDRLLAPKLPLPDLTLALADTDGSLAKLFLAPVSTPAKPGVTPPQLPHPSHAICDLVLTLDPAALKDSTLFNLVKAGADQPNIALSGVFTSRLNRSTDRFQERVAVSLSPWASVDPKDFVGRQLTNFNLLRMSLTSTDATIVKLTPPNDPDEIYDGATVVGGTKAVFPITLKDALAPLPAPSPGDTSPPWKVSWPAGPTPPQYGYFLSHIFTQDMRGTGGVEALRYVNYLTPEVAWTLEGEVAHQYGTFLPVGDPASLTLPLTTDISHPGLSVRRRIDKTNLVHSALMTWRMPDPPTALQLLFPTELLALIVTGDSVASSQSVTRYRDIYEPLADFLLCLDNKDTDPKTSKQVAGLTLRLEGWVFDGTDAANARLNPDASATEPPPVLINNMRMLGAAEIVLTPALLASQAPNVIELQKLRDVLSQPFGAFMDSVGNYAQGAASDWANLSIPLSAWTLDASKLDPAALYAKSDIVRVGLELARPAAAIPSPPTAPAAMPPGFAMAPDANTAKYFPGDFSDLKDNASLELWRYLAIPDTSGAPPPPGSPKPPDQPSALRKRFAWLRPRDGGLGTTTTSGQSRSNSPATLVGDVAPFVSWHPGSAPAIDTVLTMYYVPIAFQPLQAHPLVGDPGAVEDFVGFLLGVISDIIAGRSPQGVVLNPNPKDIGAAYDLRADVIALYRDKGDGTPSVVSALLDLIAFVEPPYTADSDPAFDPFKKIRQTAKDLENSGKDGWRRALTIMLEQTPNLYADAQGFAVAVIDHSSTRDSWNDSVMALQVSKSIPPPSGSPKNAQGQVVRDRIAFTRIHGRDTNPFFIDTFDAARYHDEFAITRNSYTPATPGPGKPARFSDGISLTGRGDAQGRIADDFLRNQMRFDDNAPVGPRRTLEVEVVPYNPVWNDFSKSSPTGTYLLPAREFPDRPVVMIPKTLDTSPDAVPPWRTELNLTFKTGSPPDLAAAYWSTLSSDVLTKTVTFAGASVDIVAQQDPKYAYPPSNPGEGGMPDGWWYLDTYATHHHFRVTPDGQDNFDLDSFLIEIQSSPEPFPADPQTTAVQPPVPDGGLLASYKYQRTIAQDRTATLTQPTVPADKLTEELRQWLSAAGGDMTKNSGLLRPYLDASRVSPAPPTPTNSFLYTPCPLLPPGSPATLQHLSGSGSLGIGDVIAVDLLKITTTGAEAWVLRVIVLDQAWKCMRVRVTHLRNQEQLQGHAEFADEFAMQSPPSSWSTFGRQAAVIDFTSDMIASRNLPQSIATLLPNMSAADFYNAKGAVSYGDALSTARDAQFTATNGKAYKMWNPAMIADSTYTVRGSVLHDRLDLHPRFRLVGSTTVSATATDQSRKETIPRQFLPASNTVVAADKVDQLVAAIDRAEVTGLHQKISVVWFNSKTEQVLTSIWPVIFNS